MTLILMAFQASAQINNLSADQIQQIKQMNEQQQQQQSFDSKDRKINKPVDQSIDQTRLDTLVIKPKIMTEKIDPKDQIFGHDIFSQENLTFAPSVNLPTPPNYILAAGDQIYVDVWGAAEMNYDLKISPDGNVTIPNIGLIPLGGLTITQAEQRIKNRLVETISGLSDGTVHIKISLGNTRSIKVNIVGEAAVPGTYTLSSLSSLFNALYAAGGVSDIGSLRNIKLYRNGKLLETLDVYDYLLNGKQDVNVQLADNDMIVIEPYSNLVTIQGSIKRPRIYELKDGEQLSTLISYAGGFGGDSYSKNVNIHRRSSGEMMEIITIAPTEDFNMQNGDSINIATIAPIYSNRIEVLGSVWRPGEYQLSEKIATVGDLIAAAQGLKDDAYAGRAQIIRTKADRTKEVISVNPAKILDGSSRDVVLIKDDQLRIFSVSELKEKPTFSIKGEVNLPMIDTMFLENMTLQDAIMMAEGLTESASLARLEVARRIKDPNSTTQSSRIAEVFSFTIPEDLSLSGSASSFRLQPFDEIFIRRSPGYNVQQAAFINGQVLFEGEYVMTSNVIRITDLLAMAGGPTVEAYLRGASLRRQLTEDDIERLRSIEKVVSSTKLTGLKDSIQVDEFQVGMYYPIGIDLADAIANPNGENNIILQNGDKVYIPTLSNIVKISGAVYYPTSTTYDRKKNLYDYITSSGGYTKMARKRPFIIYMNGKVAASNNARIEPGCEIVVPQRQARRGTSATEIVGMSSSIASMVALIMSVIK